MWIKNDDKRRDIYGKEFNVGDTVYVEDDPKKWILFDIVGKRCFLRDGKGKFTCAKIDVVCHKPPKDGDELDKIIYDATLYPATYVLDNNLQYDSYKDTMTSAMCKDLVRRCIDYFESKE